MDLQNKLYYIKWGGDHKIVGILPTGYTPYGLVENAKNMWSVVYLVVVYRSSETSINQSDVIIRSDDRFLSLVVDSDSIVSKIYMLSFVLWLFFFSVSILTKILQFYPSWVFLPSYWQTSGNFVQVYFWHSVNTHIWTSLLFIFFPE